MSLMTKRAFLYARSCLTKGWYQRMGNIDLELSQGEQFRIDEGNQVERMAREIFPDGVLVNESDDIKNSKKTKELMESKNVNIIFQATFVYENAIAKADIIVRSNDGWNLIEVKSKCYPVTKKKDLENLINDVSYTTMMMSLSGVKINKIELYLISKKFRSGMNSSELFHREDCTSQVIETKNTLLKEINSILNSTGLREKPDPKLILECKNCEFYKKYCLGKKLNHPIIELPWISKKKFNDLIGQSVKLIKDIPKDFKLTENQKKVREGIKNKKPYINKDCIKKYLSHINYPVYYLDFETASSAIPIFSDIGPYEEIVTQYSIHKKSHAKGRLEHFEYISEHGFYEPIKLIECLLKHIGHEGSVLVYHQAAEKKFINNLSKREPDFNSELDNLIDRIVDLEKIIQDSYYHPEFNGSYSIKNTLPILVPDVNYNELDIQDGETAKCIFVKLARNKFERSEAESIRKALLEYCKQDTFAMVKIHEYLSDIAFK